MSEILASLAVFDYSNNKLCDLYDSQNNLAGQAYNIKYTTNMTDGVKTLTFDIPYMIDADKNFRWDFLKSEYLIRMIYGETVEWFVATKPIKQKASSEIYGSVTCQGTESALKTKNIYMQFDDENGIGTLGDLVDKVLAGTGWTRGHTDTMYEEDGTTEKIRSISSGGKQGALGLITTLCNLFRCFCIYRSNSKTVDFYSYNNRSQVLEGRIGYNLDALSATYDSSDIITRMYVEGEYGDDGYVGIDDVNPTGLTYLVNFDYYRELGLISQEQEDALSTYLEDIEDVNARIRAKQEQITEVEDELNTLIGQCRLTIYYKSNGFTNPSETYNSPSENEQRLLAGDKVVVLQNNNEYRYETIETTASDLVLNTDYGIVKFAIPAAGKIGAAEVAVEAKEKQIETLEERISRTTKQEKIAEYNAEIADLEAGIDTLYTAEDGLHAMMKAVTWGTSGYVYRLGQYITAMNLLRDEQDDVEATFIAAMGNLLRDGYWSNTNYIVGQEQHLYDDAVEMMKQMSRPSVSYKFSYVRTMEDFDIEMKDIQLNAIFRVIDDELQINDNLFITKITIGIDHADVGSIEVSNKDITLSSNDLGALVSRMSQLADLIDQKNSLYDRAQAITRSKTLYTDRLNGQIDVVTNQIKSTVSNWYTDDQGNIIFLSADGGSAMMLSGAGWMIASEKNNDGSWRWRTAATGEGITADEIVAGFISAERIEAGSIATSKLQPDVGNTLVITGNPAITNLSDQIAPDFSENVSYTKGQYVRHNGNMYIFTSNHAAGEWDANDVLATSVSAEIELLPEKIVQTVGGLSYSKTYIQPTDPTLDNDKVVTSGDYWIVKDENNTWNEVKALTWSGVKNGHRPWGSFSGDVLMYCWNGTTEQWIRVYDQTDTKTSYSRITQTQDMIQQEVVRANAAEGELGSIITQTATEIRSEVSNGYIAKTSMYQTADAIVAEAVAQAASGGNYIEKTEQYQDASSIVSEAVRLAAEDTAGGYIAKTSTIQTADAIINEAVSQAGTNASSNYIAKTTAYQDANSIVSTAMSMIDSSMANVEQFSTTKAYAIGDRVIYNQKLYEFTKAHSAGSWSSSQVKQIYAVGSTYVTTTTLTQTSEAIIAEAVSQAGTNASNNYIAKTSAYQDANSIVSTAMSMMDTNMSTVETFSTSKAYAVGDYVIYNQRLYRFKTAHAAGSWSSSHVDRVYAVSSGYIAKTSMYQDAESIVLAAESYVDTNSYKKQSGITINSSGISITGSKYVKIESGGTFNVTSDYFNIDSTNKRMYVLYDDGRNNQLDGTNTNWYIRAGWAITDPYIYFKREIRSSTSASWQDFGSFRVGLRMNTYHNYENDNTTDFFGERFFVTRVGTGNARIDSCDYTANAINIRFAKSREGPNVSDFKDNMLRISNEMGRVKWLEAADEWLADYPKNRAAAEASGDQYEPDEYGGDGGMGAIYPPRTGDCWIIGTAMHRFYQVISKYVFCDRIIQESSREIKTDIVALEDMGDAIDALTPVSFKYKKDNIHTHYGLIYEDTVNVMPLICLQNNNEKAISYVDLVPVLLKEVQQLRKRVKELEEKTN